MNEVACTKSRESLQNGNEASCSTLNEGYEKRSDRMHPCNTLNMKLVFGLILFLCIFQIGFSQDVSKAPTIMRPDKFDQWGDAPFSDEMAHLDKIAKQLKEWKLSVVHLVIYAGQTACRGEAKARGIRAKNHLVKAQIEPERINWIDGGWKKDLTVEAWIWPPELGKPSVATEGKLKPSEVTIERNCKIKHRGGT